MNIGRIIKISSITLGSIIVIIGLAIIAIVTLINPNSYKPLIIKAVDSGTGRQLSIDGNISWKLWPNIGLHIEKTSLSNPSGFDSPNLVSIDAVDVSVQLLPLLHHSIIINSLAVDGLNLGLVKNGKLNNWTFKAATATASSGEATPPPAPMHLELNKLTLTNSIVSYTNLNHKTHKAINNFDFKITATHDGTISLNQDKENVVLKDVDFDFCGIITGNTNLTLNGFSNPKYSGDINVPDFSMPKLLTKLNHPLKAFNKPLFDKVAFKINFDGDDSAVKLIASNFSLGDNLKATMNAAISDFRDPQYSGDINVPEFSLNKVLDGLNIAKTDRANNLMLDKFALKSKFSGTKNSADLQQLSFNFPGLLNGTANLKVQDFSNLKYSGDINLPNFSLNRVMSEAGMKVIDIPNKEYLNSVAYQSNLSGGTNNINLSNIVARISDSHINGSVNVSSISPLNFSQNLTMDKFELSDITDTDGYKLPLSSIHAVGNASIGKSKNPATLNANQTINVGDVTVLGFNLNNFVAQMDNALTSGGKVVSLDNLQQISNSVQVVNAIKNMQSIIDKAKAKGQKDYSQKTNLGHLTANVVIKNGIANPATFKLSGPSIQSNGAGSVNLVGKTLDYTVNTQLITPQQNNILNSIIFPYTMHGKISNPEGSLGWGSIQKQLAEYLIKNITNQTKSIVKDQVNQVINSQIPNDNTGVKQGVTNVINGLFK